MSTLKRNCLIGSVLVIFAAALPFLLNDYWRFSLALTLFYVVMATSWNLLGGYTGQFSLSHHTFGLIGGYTSALLVTKASLPLWLGIISAGISTSVISLFLGALCLRMRGIYLALTTWAFAEIVRTYIRMDFEFTGGDRGLIVPLLFRTAQPLPYYYLFAAFSAVAIVVIAMIMRSRIGFYLRSIRNDEMAAQTMGVNTVRWKVFAFVTASVLAGVAGALHGHFTGLVSPVSGDFYEMALIVIFVVIGGLRSQTGPVVGAISIRYLAEVLKKWPEVRMILLALAVILIMRFFNGGLMDLLGRGARRLQGGSGSPPAYPAAVPEGAKDGP
jgi:branched-chain amino acid transport system permease protein